MQPALERGKPADSSLAVLSSSLCFVGPSKVALIRVRKPWTIFNFRIFKFRRLRVLGATLISAAAQMVPDRKTSDFETPVLSKLLLGNVLIIGGVWRALGGILEMYYVNFLPNILVILAHFFIITSYVISVHEAGGGYSQKNGQSS